MTTPIGECPLRNYMDAVQNKPLLPEQKKVIDTINEKIALVLDDATNREQIRFLVLVEVPAILSTTQFLNEVHEYVIRIFKELNTEKCHVCISESYQEIKYHRNSAGQDEGEEHRVSYCTRKRLVG